MLAGGLGLTLLASCGGTARLEPADFATEARAVCGRATAALRQLPSPGPTSDEPLPNLVRNLLQWGKDTSMIVFVSPVATPDELATVRQAVTGADGVARFRFLDQSAAKAQFDVLFAGSELVDSVAAADLPTSFNIVVDRDADVDALVVQFSAASGVQSVKTVDETVVPLLRTIRAFARRAATIRQQEADALDDLPEPSARKDAVGALVAALRTEAAGLRAVDRAAAERDQQAAARLVTAAAGRTATLSRAAARAGLPACGRSAWPTLMGAGRT